MTKVTQEGLDKANIKEHNLSIGTSREARSLQKGTEMHKTVEVKEEAGTATESCKVEGCEVRGSLAGIKRHMIARHGQDWRVAFPEDHQRTRSHRVLIPGGQTLVKVLAGSADGTKAVKALGGGWYEVNGLKVQGKAKAEAAAK